MFLGFFYNSKTLLTNPELFSPQIQKFYQQIWDFFPPKFAFLFTIYYILVTFISKCLGFYYNFQNDTEIYLTNPDFFSPQSQNKKT